MTVTEQKNTEELWDIEAVAEFCGVRTKTVRRWMEAGEIPQPIRLGRRLLRWRRTDLHNWISQKGES